MPTPGAYFDDPKESELADRVWAISATLPGKWELHSTHEALNNSALPWLNKRIIYARDWITYYRELDSDGGVRSLNQALGGTHYTAEQIGNVEHFYVSALLGTLGGPVGGIFLNIIAGAVWEMGVGPARIAWSSRSLAKVLNNYKHNWGQLTGPDLAGTRFGSLYSINQPIDELLGVPTEYDPGAPTAPVPTYPVVAGDSLSLISKKKYVDLELWPLIYDANKALIGPDYNKIRPGQVLKIPDKMKFTPAQIADARQRHRNWRP
jgi:hypothetical protein